MNNNFLSSILANFYPVLMVKISAYDISEARILSHKFHIFTEKEKKSSITLALAKKTTYFNCICMKLLLIT